MVIDIVNWLTDASWSQLNENGIVINYDGNIIHVNGNFKDTMKDLKSKH